jgi:hypothetical protein
MGLGRLPPSGSTLLRGLCRGRAWEEILAPQLRAVRMLVALPLEIVHLRSRQMKTKTCTSRTVDMALAAMRLPLTWLPGLRRSRWKPSGAAARRTRMHARTRPPRVPGMTAANLGAPAQQCR